MKLSCFRNIGESSGYDADEVLLELVSMLLVKFGKVAKWQPITCRFR